MLWLINRSLKFSIFFEAARISSRDNQKAEFVYFGLVQLPWKLTDQNDILKTWNNLYEFKHVNLKHF